jgi:fumarylacetoacetate (FAA) hydrolase
VSNEAADDDWSIGCGCIGEYRAIETIQSGSAQLAFMQAGDRLRIELLDYQGNSKMGVIDQVVTERGIKKAPT